MSIIFSTPYKFLASPDDFIQTLSEELQPEPADMQDATIVCCSEIAEGRQSSKWMEDSSYTFYISNLSNRGLEVWIKDSHFYVRVLTVACVDEWWLALRFLELASASRDALVTNDWKLSPCSLLFFLDEHQFLLAPIAAKQLQSLAKGVTSLCAKVSPGK